uniref:Uncharacterized protein n=1 Tax=Cucumis melo TaxID=3656 RepID=A0A9I9EIN9_CUCME
MLRHYAQTAPRHYAQTAPPAPSSYQIYSHKSCILKSTFIYQSLKSTLLKIGSFNLGSVQSGRLVNLIINLVCFTQFGGSSGPNLYTRIYVSILEMQLTPGNNWKFPFLNWNSDEI